jgi:hypothetical protein
VGIAERLTLERLRGSQPGINYYENALRIIVVIACQAAVFLNDRTDLLHFAVWSSLKIRLR